MAEKKGDEDWEHEPLTNTPPVVLVNDSEPQTSNFSDYPGGIDEEGRDVNEVSNPEGQAMDANRVQWGGQIEFILTCVGYAVGLGNVWRFPYLAFRNGGGAFLIPYIIMLALVGLPLFFMELALGQFASLGPIAIWRINPLLKGVGYCSVWVSWLIGLYYNVIIAHILFYLGSSFTSELPWQRCGHPWNTPACVERDSKSKMMANITTMINSTFTPSTTSTTSTITSAFSSSMSFNNVNTTNNMTMEPRTPAEEYYNFFVLQIDPTQNTGFTGNVQWKLAICLFIAWTFVCLVLIKGISSLGKVVYFTAIFPYVMLTVLFFRGVTLPGAGKGLLYYITPKFEKLLEPAVWSDAATQIFYSLSACSGGLIAMSSYNKFKNNCYRDSLIVALINCSTSIFAGLVIFSVLGFMSEEKGVPIEKVAKGGAGLAFVVYPEALANMPVAPLWSVFFFIMLATLGFGSQFSIVECVLSAFTDEFPKYLKPRRNNIIFRVAACFMLFLLGLPMVTQGGIHILNLVDGATGGFPLLVVAMLELVAVNWIYGYSRFASDIEMMLGSKPNVYWKATWLAISPLAVMAVLIGNMVSYKPPGSSDGIIYQPWQYSLAICVACFPIAWIPCYFLGYFFKFGGFDILKINSMPLSTWGPNHPEHRDLEPEVYEPVRQSDTETNKPQAASYRTYKPGHISSIASDLNALGSRSNLSVSTATFDRSNSAELRLRLGAGNSDLEIQDSNI